MSNSLDPDQARQNVGPDLDPNCLQRCNQQTTKVASSRKRVKNSKAEWHFDSHVDPDEMSLYKQSYLDLHFLQKYPVW